jgi:D-arabinose 1-dehydrogenase-like Zn-dependent alcohol dehydrogenase
MTTTVEVATMRAAQVTAAGAGLRIVQLETPDPDPGQVRIKVQAGGVCHSDAIIVQGRRPGTAYPRVPGHEVAGVVDALRTGVTEWREGQRVGVGRHGGRDGACPECRPRDYGLCRNEKNPDLSYDCGYQEYVLAPVRLFWGGETIEGWAGVTPANSDDTLRFADLRGVRAMIATCPLEKAAEAYAPVMSGNEEFRVVLTM